MEQKLNIQLSLDEANTVLEALGQMPFVRVYRIIESIQQQAQPQTVPAQSAAAENGAAATNGKKAAVTN
jgi:hypothetical protein